MAALAGGPRPALLQVACPALGATLGNTLHRLLLPGFARNANLQPFCTPPQLVLDLSSAAALADMRPSRIAVLSGVAQLFIRTFFDENPLSQLGIILMRNGVAEQLTELSSSPVGFYFCEHRVQMQSGQSGCVQGSGGAALAKRLQWVGCWGVAEQLDSYPAPV